MTEGKLSDFIAGMMTAISNCSLYSEKHPIVNEFTESSFGLLKDLYADESFRITLLGDSLVINENPLTEKGIHFDNLKKRLRRKGIEKIDIRRGITVEEFKKFIEGVASKEAVLTSPHISVGIVEVRSGSEGFSVKSLIEDNIAKVKGLYQGISHETELDIESMEETVIGLISAVKREANVLNIISPIKTYNEYTHVHATNVSVLTIFQARTLGMNEETIYDVGLAGLLHDVGKMFVPKEVLNKRASLGPNEWNLMKLHTVYGARYLSALHDAPKIVMIVAFEHHMKFDGSGYPDAVHGGKRQHLVSQMVELSDFFDALRTARPHRKPLEAGPIANFLTKGAGREFNPVLVENFVGALMDINAI
ncbi:MAG TPA: HD domain-containing phosphohydrolase [Thermodesulfovibrionales bacterium]|nr:HD domain-containing phosphohydrolase [Thermodesulfovibrionales bacterium]